MASAATAHSHLSLRRTSWDGSTCVDKQCPSAPSTPRLRTAVCCAAYARSPAGPGGQKPEHPHSKAVAREVMLGLLRCMAITKLYQASAIRVLGTHAQAIASTRGHHSTGHGSPTPERSVLLERSTLADTLTQASTTLERPSVTATATAPIATSTPSSSPVVALPALDTRVPSNTLPDLPDMLTGGLHIPTDKSPVNSQYAAVVEAALWQDEIRSLQARRDQLSIELVQLTQQLQERWAGQLAALGPSTFYSPGAEFCPITSLVSCSPDVAALKANLKREIRTLSSQLSIVWPQMAASAMAAVLPSPVVTAPAGNVPSLSTTADADATSTATIGAAPSRSTASLTSHPLVEDSQKVIKHLQSDWQKVGLEVAHLMVRLAQLRQLPAQPKKRITVAYVTEQLVAELYARQAHLQRYSQQL